MANPNKIFIHCLICMICMFNWCNPALMNTVGNAKDTGEAGAGSETEVSSRDRDTRVLVLNPTDHMLHAAHYNSTLYVDHLNMLLAQLPVIKLGIVRSVLSFIIPALHVILIFSLIAFSITGTVALACSVFECGELFGAGFGHWHGHGHHHPYASTFLKKNFRTSNINGVQPYYNYPAKHWNSFDARATQNMLDEAYGKFQE